MSLDGTKSARAAKRRGMDLAQRKLKSDNKKKKEEKTFISSRHLLKGCRKKRSRDRFNSCKFTLGNINSRKTGQNFSISHVLAVPHRLAGGEILFVGAGRAVRAERAA